MNARPVPGFTLIELMIALAIFAILVLAALPSFQVWIQNTQIRTTAEAILNGLQLSRAEAVRRNTKIELELSADSGWTIRETATGQVIQARSAGEGTGGAVISVTPSGAVKTTFNGLGRVDFNDNATPAITEIKVDSSVITATDSRELCIRISTAGVVRLCDPQLSASDPRSCGATVPTGCL